MSKLLTGKLWSPRGLAFALVATLIAGAMIYTLSWRDLSVRRGTHFSDVSFVTTEKEPLLSSFRFDKLWANCAVLFAHIRNRDVRDTYVDELYVVLSLIRCGYHGGFIRYGDGEMALIQGRPIAADSQGALVDHFTWDTRNQSALGRRIRKTLTDPAPAILYGISCSQCLVSINREILPILRQRPGMWSYSVLFHNANYQAFSAWLELIAVPRGNRRVIGNRSLVLMVSEETRGRNLSWADDVQYLPIECVRRYEGAGEAILQPYLNVSNSYSDAVFLVSGGPLAKWLVYRMFRANPKNFYIDVGSAMDFFVKGTATRPFHTQRETHVCSQH